MKRARLYGEGFNKKRNDNANKLAQKYRKQLGKLVTALLAEPFDSHDLRLFFMAEFNLAMILQSLQNQSKKAK